MGSTKIGEAEFSKLVLAEFPQLQDDFREWSGLEHLQMMEFALFTQKAIKAADWSTVDRCVRLADVLLRDGDARIRNATCVSFLESLPRGGEVYDRIRGIMTPGLQKSWDELLDYLAALPSNNPA